MTDVHGSLGQYVPVHIAYLLVAFYVYFYML